MKVIIDYHPQLTNLIDRKNSEALTSKQFFFVVLLVEQKTYTLFHLYPIPIYDDRTGIHHKLSFFQKYIERVDDSLMYVTVKDLSVCKPLLPRQKLCLNLYAYPIDNITAFDALFPKL